MLWPMRNAAEEMASGATGHGLADLGIPNPDRSLPLLSTASSRGGSIYEE